MIMCPSCGHPQEAAERCAACGAALPPSLRGEPGEAPPPPAPPRPQPRQSVRIGQTELLLRGDTLELRRFGKSRALSTGELVGFHVSKRPLIEALAAGFVFAGLAALVHSRDLRLLLLLLDVLMLAAAFAYSRYRFVALTRGKELLVASMIVRRRSREERALREGLSALRAFLSLRGVAEGK